MQKESMPRHLSSLLSCHLDHLVGSPDVAKCEQGHPGMSQMTVSAIGRADLMREWALVRLPCRVRRFR